jgi:magnesium-transporting ATPase (P-type)
MGIINNLLINMPIKWYGNGDLEDPTYKHFSRIVNFVIHCMIFTAVVSGTYLLKEIKYEIAFFNNFAIIWSILLASHLLFLIIKKPKDLEKQST